MSLVRPTQEQLRTANPDLRADITADYMEYLNPGRQPIRVFTQMCRISVPSTFEITPFRAKDEKIEVLLAQRPADDRWWPAKWHVPGSAVMPREEIGIHDYGETADAILSSEFQDAVTRTSNVQVFDAHIRTGVRGTEQTVFGWTEVEQVDGVILPSDSKFFDARALLSDSPEDLIVDHDLTIKKALGSYLVHQAMKSKE